MDEDEHPGMPLWAKLLIGVAAVILAGFVALHLLGVAPMRH
jgi:hypothetical protein